MTVLVFVFSAGLLISLVPAITGFGPTPKVSAAYPDQPRPDCNPKNNKLLGIIPPWYEYLGGNYGVIESSNLDLVPHACGIISEPTDHPEANVIWKIPVLIGMAVIDMLLRAGALVAVAFIMMGGYRYMSSQGEPKNIEVAMATLVNSAIGLAIVLMATVIVAFIGNRLGG